MSSSTRCAWLNDVPVVIYPPEEDRLRAFCSGAIRVEPPRPFLVRNRIIVDACRSTGSYAEGARGAGSRQRSGNVVHRALRTAYGQAVPGRVAGWGMAGAMRTARATFDGGCRPKNPGYAGFAVVIDLDGEEHILSRLIGIHTNNWAEYTALIVAIKYARHLGAEQLEVV